MSVRSETAVEDLKAHLGISAEDAALYLHLTVAGASKASDVSDALRMHRSEVYRAMDRLAARGLVLVREERPTLYAAVDIEELLESELKQRMAAIEALRATRTEIEGIMAATRPAEAAARVTYKVLHGRREIYQARALMIRSATRTLDWATTLPHAVALWEQSGEMALARRRAAEGVRFRALLPRSPAFEDAVRLFDEIPTAELRRLESAGQVRFLVADERELLIFIVNDPSSRFDAEDEVAIQTTAPGFVAAQMTFFEQSWRGVVAPPPRAPTLSAAPVADLGLMEPRAPRARTTPRAGAR